MTAPAPTRPALHAPGTASCAPFDHLPATPESHFRLHFYAAVYALIRYVRSLGDAGPDGGLARHLFLQGYLDEILRVLPQGVTWTRGTAWWDEQIDCWERRCAVRLPLRSMRDEAGLSRAACTAFVLVGLIEEDARFGSVFDDLQAPLTLRRPTPETAGRIATRGDDPWASCRPLVEGGFVVVEQEAAPRSEWGLRVPRPVWDAAREGVPMPGDGFTYHRWSDAPAETDLLVATSFRDRLARVPPLLAAGRVTAVVLRGTPGSDRLPALQAVARRLDRSVLAAPLDLPAAPAAHLGPVCVLTGAMPVFTCDLAPGETAAVPELKGYRGPVGVAAGPEGGLNGRAMEQAVVLRVPLLDAPTRRRAWEAAFSGRPVADLDGITERFCLPGGHVRRVARAAAAGAALDGRRQVTPADVRDACRTLGRQLLDTLAERLEVAGTWNDVVVGAATRSRLQELMQRCRHRERLLAHLGPAFGAGANRGVRALFAGPSGTGKTLAARVLAAELGLDLYRVDLAAVVNKYIGETEKNLHRVLATAEELDVILLLDEGDALLGSRTDVRSANDRYANLETNYLLQRLEHYQGIVVVTTNLAKNVDRAFQRRMDVVVDFSLPQAEERWLLWQLHLPARHRIDAGVLEMVAARCRLTGGQIRNAALLASLLALDENAPVATRHLEDALRREYRKAGATCPLDAPTAAAGPATVQAFLNAL